MPRIIYNRNTNTFILRSSVFSLFKEMEPYKLKHLNWTSLTNELIFNAINPAILSETDLEFIAQIKNYIMSFSNGEGLTQNAKISFEKIKLADKLAGVFQGKANNEDKVDNEMMDVEQQKKGKSHEPDKLKAAIEEIYREAVKLDSMQINGRKYPNGRLGDILISLYCKADSKFRECYERHVKSQDLPVQFYKSYG